MKQPDVSDVLRQRQQTHGHYYLNARIMEQLIDVLRSSPYWLRTPHEVRNALTMTCAKMSRIVNQDGWKHKDNYVDIIGYITLAHEATIQFEELSKEEETYL